MERVSTHECANLQKVAANQQDDHVSGVPETVVRVVYNDVLGFLREEEWRRCSITSFVRYARLTETKAKLQVNAKGNFGVSFLAGVVIFLEVKTGAAASTHDVGDVLDERVPITILKDAMALLARRQILVQERGLYQVVLDHRQAACACYFEGVG